MRIIQERGFRELLASPKAKAERAYFDIVIGTMREWQVATACGKVAEDEVKDKVVVNVIGAKSEIEREAWGACWQVMLRRAPAWRS